MRSRIIAILLVATMLCCSAQAGYQTRRGVASRPIVSSRTAVTKASSRQVIYQYAKSGNLRGLKTLQSRGYALDMYDAHGNSALCEAALRKDKKAAETLLAAGANENAPCMRKIPVENKQAVGVKITVLKTSKEVFNDIYRLASEQKKEELEKMRSCGVNLDTMNLAGNTAYCQAIIDENCEAYTTLREVGVDTNHACVCRMPTDKQELSCGSCTACLWVGLGAAALIGGGVGLASGGGGGGSSGAAIVCGAGYHLEGDACVADACTGYELTSCPANGTCSECQSGDTTKYKLDSCDAGYTQSGNACVANACTGYELAACPVGATSCSECQSGSTIKYKVNGCKTGYEASGNTCVVAACTGYELTSCPANGQCSPCQAGDTTKYKLDSCDAGYTQSGNACVANACTGYELAACPVGATSCSECQSGSTIKYKVNGCKTGYEASGNTCVVAACTGYELTSCPANGQCSPCQAGDTTKYKLDSCDAGYTQSGNTCVANACTGYELTSCPANGQCSPCQAGDTTKYKLDSCDAGYTQSGNACVANACTGYELTACPVGATSCSECQSGSTIKYKVDGCNTGYEASGNTCVVAACTGYELTACPVGATSCSECQSGSTIKYKVNGCKTGYEASGNTCVVAACTGYELASCPANGQCSPCQSGDTTKYKLDSCDAGYTPNATNTACVANTCTGTKNDINNCQTYHNQCTAPDGEYHTCQVCNNGYKLSTDELTCTQCEGVKGDIANCTSYGSICAASDGEYHLCTACATGYTPSADGLSCDPIYVEKLGDEVIGQVYENSENLDISTSDTALTDAHVALEVIRSQGTAINKATITMTSVDDATATYGMKASVSDATLTNQGQINAEVNNSSGTVSFYGMYSDADNDTLTNDTGASITVTGSATASDSRVAGMQTTTSSATNNGTIDLTLTQLNPTSGVSEVISAFGMTTESGTLTNAGTMTISADRYAGGMFSENSTSAMLINEATGNIHTTNTNSGGAVNGARSVGMYTDGSAINRGSITALGGSMTQITGGMISGGQVGSSVSGASLQNEKTIVVSSSSQRAYGMAALENRANATLANTSAGTISVSSDVENAYGMRTVETGSTITNAGTINVTGAGQIGRGIEAGENATITNTGTITVSNAPMGYGIYAKGNGGTITNDTNATIDVTATNAYGIYVADGTNTTVINRGTITLNGTSCVGAACNTGNYIVLNGATLQTSGLMQGLSMNLNSMGGSVVANSGAQFNVQNALSGTLNISADLTTTGFDKTYVGEGMINAGDTSNLNLVSNSALFTASLADNGSDVVMQMKDFDEVVSNKSLAEFLDANYASGNNEALYNVLKQTQDLNAFNDTLNELTGKEMLSRFAFEDMTMMKELNFDMNNNLFSKEENYFAMAGNVSSPVAFKGDLGSNSRYSLMNRREGRWSLGMGVAFTDIKSDNRHNKDSRTDSMYQLVVPIGYRTHGINFMVSPRMGYAYGTYDRTGFEGRTYDGTVQKRIFGLMNEARYPIMVGKWKFEPAVELNALGYEQTGDEDSKEYSLTIPRQRTYSVESGIGLYATREVVKEDGTKLKLTAGVAGYHEFADPYKVEVGIRAMNGKFVLKDEDRTRNRAVARAGFEFDEGDYSLYGNVVSYIDGEVRAKAKVGLKYVF